MFNPPLTLVRVVQLVEEMNGAVVKMVNGVVLVDGVVVIMVKVSVVDVPNKHTVPQLVLEAFYGCLFSVTFVSAN